MRRLVGGVLLLGWVALAAGCDVYSRPNRPVPKEFKAHTLDGGLVDEATFRGKAWVVNVWVPGCAPCVRELPVLEALRQEYEGRGVGFLALSLEPDPKQVFAAARRLGISMPVAIAEGEVLAPFGVNQVPSTLFIADGVVVAAVNGERQRGFFVRRVEELLAR